MYLHAVETGIGHLLFWFGDGGGCREEDRKMRALESLQGLSNKEPRPDI